MSTKQRFQIRIVGPEGARVELLEKTDMVLGRSAQADIIISNSEVSRRHAVLMHEGEKLFIVDEGSKNGTFIDEVKIPPHAPQILQPGQTLRFGVAPERIMIEAVAHSEDPDSPPPIVPAGSLWGVSVVAPVKAGQSAAPSRSTTSEKAPVQRRETQPVPEISLSRPKVQTPAAAAAPEHAPMPAPAATASKVNAQLEKREREIQRREQELAEREEKARARLANAEREVEQLRLANEEAKKQGQDELQAARLEKAKVESQLREIQYEVRYRLDERKELSRELADYKLQTQKLQQEIQNLTVGREQLSTDLGQELTSLEEKVSQAREQQQKASKDALEKAKKQAELLLTESEVKAKQLRDKAAAEVADAKKAMELDLADFRLKQMQELKTQQEREENRWLERREQAIARFVAELRAKSEDLVSKGGLDANIKTRLQTTVEDILNRNFADSKFLKNLAPAPVVAVQAPVNSITASSPNAVAVKSVTGPVTGTAKIPRPAQAPAQAAAANSESETVAGGIIITSEVVDSEEDSEADLGPSFWSQYGRAVSVAAASLVVIVGLFAVRQMFKFHQQGAAQLASERPAPPIAEPRPLAPPPVVTAPAVAVPVAPPVVAPPPEPVQAAPAPPPVQAQPQPPPAPPQPRVVKPPVATSLPQKTAAPSILKLSDGFQSQAWEQSLTRFLSGQLKMDHSRAQAFMHRDSQFRADMQLIEIRSQSPKERNKALNNLENRYEKEGAKLLGGSANWRKFKDFRQNYLKKIR